MEDTLYIVDALNFLFRAYHALPPLTTSRGLSTGAVYGLCQMLLRVERENHPTHLVAVFDAPGPNFRHELYTGYKADRPPMPPELAGQVAIVHQVIETFRIPSLSVPAVEADDVIASLACHAARQGMKVVMCSSDKDLTQICTEQIVLLDTMRNRRLGPAEVKEKFGVPPEQVGDVLALMGDSIDNVPGVAGIGPKTAADLINRFGSLDELLARAAEVKGKKGEALVAAKEAVILSRRLVALKTDVELPVELEALRRIPPAKEPLVALFKDLEFTRLIVQERLTEDGPWAGPLGGGQPSGASQGSLSWDRPPPPAGSAPPASASPPGAPAPFGPVPVPLPIPPPPPTSPAEIVRDKEGLATVGTRLRAAGAFAVGALTEGGDASRADLVGLALALPDGDRIFVPVGPRLLDEPTGARLEDVLGALGPALADPALAKTVHDGKFLEVLLAARGHGLGGVVADTLLGAYLLDASRTRYEVDVLGAAVGLTHLVPRAAWLGSGRTARKASEVPSPETAERLTAEVAALPLIAAAQKQALAAAGLDRLLAEMELPLSSVLAQMESRGIRLDREQLRGLGEELSVSIQALEQQIYGLAGTTFNIGSPKQLGEVLFTKLALPVVRRTKTGPSTDADVLEELASLHDVPAKIVEYRGLTKLKSTYIEALPALVHPRTGRLHTTFNQAVAATGRLSSSEPNLQNIPIRTDVGRRIRAAFVADEGFRIVSADYSQIELRILAHYSEDPAFLDAFRIGADIHQRTAAEVFSLKPEDVTGEQRRIAKAINFGLVFGQTDFGLAQTLRVPRATAKAYIASYFERYVGVRTYMERAIAEARDAGGVTTLFGRRRPIPEILSRRPQERAHAERVARNTPIQGSAADLLKMAMIRVADGMRTAWPAARLLLTVHDELVFEVEEASVAGFSAWVRGEMESVHTLRVPLVVDVGAGRTWGEAH